MNDNDNPPPVETVAMSAELAALLHRQREIDIADAGPKLPVAGFVYRGVQLESRWSVAAELDEMRAIVDALPDLVRARVSMVWCDSNAQACYTVTTRPGRWAEGIELDVLAAVKAATCGFNGLSVEGDGHDFFYGAEWPDDDYDYGAV